MNRYLLYQGLVTLILNIHTYLWRLISIEDTTVTCRGFLQSVGEMHVSSAAFCKHETEQRMFMRRKLPEIRLSKSYSGDRHVAIKMQMDKQNIPKLEVVFWSYFAIEKCTYLCVAVQFQPSLGSTINFEVKGVCKCIFAALSTVCQSTVCLEWRFLLNAKEGYSVSAKYRCFG